jgi:hypothetical protein
MIYSRHEQHASINVKKYWYSVKKVICQGIFKKNFGAGATIQICGSVEQEPKDSTTPVHG